MTSATTSKPMKILVSGDVQGNFQQLYKRVETIQKKNGNFDLLLCIGEFFGSNLACWEPYKSGKVKVPISTLVLGPCHEEMAIYYDGTKGADLCEGVTYLGKQGRFTGSSGLSIAYISGVESSTDKGDNHTFTQQDIKSLISPMMTDGSYKGLDILITAQWPSGVEKYAMAAKKPESSASQESALIAEAARVLRPRYHFAGLQDVFYERQPYRNHQLLLDTARHTTRFISLASVPNKDKQKYLYAFTIVPLTKMDTTELTKQPPDVTECPYLPMDLTSQTEETSQQFFYDMNAKHGGNKRKGNKDRGDREKKPRKAPEPTGPCWFCLGSPEVEKHLVVSVSDKAYVALAKGGLVPDHVLILPVYHYQSYISCPDDVISQIEQYKNCLHKMFKSQNKRVVFFERNFRTQHLQIQAVPIPEDCVMDVKEAFFSCSETHGVELTELPKHSDIKQIVSDGEPYFYAELPSKEKLLHRIKHKFPLQFGREAMCDGPVLDLPDRIDWKKCQVGKEEETDLAKTFKTQFRQFDFNFL